MWTKKSNRPNTKPCGTQEMTGQDGVFQTSTRMACSLSRRKPTSHLPSWHLMSNYRHILARHKRRKCLATGSQELSWLSVCTTKWHFMASLAKNILGFSPFWALKSKTRFPQGTKMKRTIGFLFRPIREEHQQQQRSPGSSAARWVVLKLEKPSKIPHIHKFVSFEI